MGKRYVVLIALVVNIGFGYSQTSIPKAKALFIYNFTRHIDWPDAYKSGNFVVGIIGGGEIVTEINTILGGKKVSAQDIKVENFKDASEAGNCHILFIAYGRSDQLQVVLDKMANRSTLIITERNGLSGKGTIINFVLDGNALKFELNIDEAVKRNLSIHSSLERMAIVR